MTKVLYAGRLSPIKDIPTLEKAVALLDDKAKLEIVTDFPYAENAKIFKSADIMVVPTQSKSLDKVFLEGLASGVPTIGTDIGYPFMKDKFPQLVFQAGDAKDLAKKINWLIENPSKAKTITIQAKKFVRENFDLEKLAARMVRAIKPPVYYITNSRFPTEKAHGVQVAKNCEALLDAGVNLNLILPHRVNRLGGDSQAYYHLRENIPVKHLASPDFLAWNKPRLENIFFLLQTFIFSLEIFLFSLLHNKESIFTRDMYLPLFCFHPGRVLMEVHELPRSRIGKMVVVWVAKQTKIVFCVNQAVKDFFATQGISIDKLVLSPNGVDVKAFQVSKTTQEAKKLLGFPQKGKAVVYTGGFYKRKGVDFLVATSKLLPENYRVFLFGGPEPEKIRLEGIIKASKLTGRVRLDSVEYNRIPLVLRAADVLVIPNVATDPYASDQTSPLKLFEYLASGKPIVATDVPSIRRLTKENDVYFVSPDDEEALAKEIIRVASLEKPMIASVARLRGIDLKRRAEIIRKWL